MDKLNFYTVDLEYGENRKPKFLCGVVLQVNNVDYYVPVTSYKQ